MYDENIRKNLKEDIDYKKLYTSIIPLEKKQPKKDPKKKDEVTITVGDKCDKDQTIINIKGITPKININININTNDKDKREL